MPFWRSVHLHVLTSIPNEEGDAKMKTYFEEPKLETVLFAVEDILTISGGEDDDTVDDNPNRLPLA